MIWLTILGTIAAVALSIGAQHVSDRIERLKAQANNLSQDQIVSRLKGELNRIAKEDSALYSKIAAKLSSYPEADRIISSKAAEQIRQKKKQATEQMVGIEQRMRDNDTMGERITSYAYLPDSYKLSSAGQQDLSRIENDLSKLSERRMNDVQK